MPFIAVPNALPLLANAASGYGSDLVNFTGKKISNLNQLDFNTGAQIVLKGPMDGKFDWAVRQLNGNLGFGVGDTGQGLESTILKYTCEGDQEPQIHIGADKSSGWNILPNDDGSYKSMVCIALDDNIGYWKNDSTAVTCRIKKYTKYGGQTGPLLLVDDSSTDYFRIDADGTPHFGTDVFFEGSEVVIGGDNGGNLDGGFVRFNHDGSQPDRRWHVGSDTTHLIIGNGQDETVVVFDEADSQIRVDNNWEFYIGTDNNDLVRIGSNNNGGYLNLGSDSSSRQFWWWVKDDKMSLGTSLNNNSIMVVDDTQDLVHIKWDLTVDGDLTVNGTTTTINTTELDVEDNIIRVNIGQTGTPTLDGGLEVERGTSTNAQLLWNEATDQWEVGVVGSLSPILTTAGLSDYVNKDGSVPMEGNLIPDADNARAIGNATTRFNTGFFGSFLETGGNGDRLAQMQPGSLTLWDSGISESFVIDKPAGANPVTFSHSEAGFTFNLSASSHNWRVEQGDRRMQFTTRNASEGDLIVEANSSNWLALNAKLTGNHQIRSSKRIDSEKDFGFLDSSVWVEQSAPSVSASGESKVYMDSTSKTLKVSQNGGAFVDLVNGGGAPTFPLEAPDGSASTPSFSFSGDTDTGIYRIGADNLGFSTGSARQMDISNLGMLLSSGARVNEFSTDGTMADDSDKAVPTEKAVREYVSTKAGSRVIYVASSALGDGSGKDASNAMDAGEVYPLVFQPDELNLDGSPRLIGKHYTFVIVSNLNLSSDRAIEFPKFCQECSFHFMSDGGDHFIWMTSKDPTDLEGQFDNCDFSCSTLDATEVVLAFIFSGDETNLFRWYFNNCRLTSTETGTNAELSFNACDAFFTCTNINWNEIRSYNYGTVGGELNFSASKFCPTWNAPVMEADEVIISGMSYVGSQRTTTGCNISGVATSIDVDKGSVLARSSSSSPATINTATGGAVYTV